MATTTTLVSNASQLLAALNAATGGETILLKSGTDFGQLQFTNHAFTSKVTIQSQDPSNPAHLSNVIFNAVSNLTIDSVAIGGTLKPPFTVTNSEVTFTNIAVTNLSVAPTDLTDTNAAINTVAESAVIGTAVGLTAKATDVDVGDRITYSLVDSAGGKFDISSSSGIVTVAAPLDFETATSHNITVKATDLAGLSTTQTFTINVSNANETPITLVDSNTAANTVAENAAVGTLVGVVAGATDPDAGDKITYSLTNNASGKFAIDANTGVVSVAGAINYEAGASQTITVKATDAGGLSTTQNFTVGVTDVNEAPTTLVDSNAAANSVLQTASVGTVVGVTAKATDVDAGDKITYSLTDGCINPYHHRESDRYIWSQHHTELHH